MFWIHVQFAAIKEDYGAKMLPVGTRGIIIQNNDVKQNAAIAKFGAGIWLQGGAGGAAENIVQGNVLSQNRFVGLGLIGDTHGIIIQGNEIRETALGQTGAGDLKNTQIDVGDGIFLAVGASAAIRGNTVAGNRRFGLLIDEAGASSTTTVETNQFLDHDQFAIIIQNQPSPPTTDSNVFTTNKLGNVSIVPAGTYGRRVELLRESM